MSKILLPHCVRTFPCPRIFPWVTGLCLNSSSPTALHRRAETCCAWSHRGTADIRGMWMTCWSLVMLQGTLVAASPAASASCCVLLHPVPCGLFWALRSGHMPLHQLLQGVQDISSSPCLLCLAKPSSPREETLSAAIQLLCAKGHPAGLAKSTHPQQRLSHTWVNRQNSPFPMVSTFSQVPAPVSSSWPPSVSFYT